MAERVESEGFYEMLWDCDHCETKGLLGKSQRHCPECGAPQSAIKRYFPKPDQAKRVEGHQYEGADRYCPACNAPMAAKAKNCTQCGSPMDGSKQVGATVAAAVKPRRAIWPYVLLGIVALCVLIWFVFLRKKDAQMTLAGHRWKTTVAIEQYGEWDESSWRSAMPNDAIFPSCSQRERSKKQVADGEECHEENVDKHDGTFEVVKKCHTKYRSEPVYDDWCSYRVRKWQKVDEVTATGAGTTLAWPVAPDAGAAAAIGAKRAGARSQTLTLDFGSGGTCDVDEKVWRAYSDGQKVKLQVRVRSGAIVCSSL